METSLSLLERMRSAHEGAWERFVQIYSPLVYSWCRRSGLDAESSQQVSSDVFNVVFLKLDQFRPGRFRSWLRTIVRSKLVDLARLRNSDSAGVGGSTHRRAIEASPTPEALDEDELQDAREVSFIFKQAVQLIKDEFPSHYWEIFQAYVIDDVATEDVAKRFEVSRDLVYQVKRRVITRLRSELSGLL